MIEEEDKVEEEDEDFEEIEEDDTAIPPSGKRALMPIELLR